MRVCRHAIVKGRVQGVFYRQNTLNQAKRLNLMGWVRNLPSGEVELMVCGEADKVDVLCQWLWEGPTQAKVTEVVFTDQPVEQFQEFEIR